MPTVAFEINLLKNKRYAIHVRLSDGVERVFRRKTGFTITKSNWDTKNGLPKPNDDLEKRKRNKLIELREVVYNKYDQALLDDIEINKAWLDQVVDTFFSIRKATDDDRLLTYLDHYIDSVLPYKPQKGKIKGVSKRTIQKYHTLKEKLSGFEKHNTKQYYIKDVSPKFAIEFDKYLTEEEKLGPSTTGGYIAALKTMCLYAGDKDDKKNHPKVRNIGVYSGERKIKTILSLDELETIKKCDKLDDSQKIARDWLLIGCNTAQRVSDLLGLTKENLKVVSGSEVIDMSNEKTGKELYIPLFDEVREVLDKYDGEFPPKISDQHFNRLIKKVAEAAGLKSLEYGELNNPKTNRKEKGEYPKWQLVSSHIMRRSFATNYYGKYPTPLLMQITKHSTERQFLEYIHKDAIDHVKQFEYEIQKNKSGSK
ncbi:tyrosine-type recombinase/integrase [Maribellus sediminis]|uniref:tyrosine-type recombinase/integrase n=1 Tax=Maribellus sediminis TaxID=2696285 RepID=UPI001431B1E7|nr:tyrosine-type recombinase/integrase [Maribellus sediminis]